jgi:RNA polymerase sigma-70 factor (ECF subfamily)
MLDSFDDAEDLVQATLLRAWRARASFEGGSLVRTWLYRIATNACLNTLERAPRQILPQDVVAPVTARSSRPWLDSDTPRGAACPDLESVWPCWLAHRPPATGG